ncbi:MAG: hypothetical protein K2J39_07220 [Ruminococcus sp.]|nr:hypothetical protein [Ruminococcus sp.]
MLIEMAIGGAIGKMFYDGNKSLKMDAEATAKYSKAFTREYEAQQLVAQKRNLADKRLENVAKKKKAIINSSLPMFVEVYGQIQKINIQQKDRNFEMIPFSDAEKSGMLQSISVVAKKDFTDKELITGIIFKGFSGMMVEDSKRNLSAARSQLSASNAVYSQAMSIAEVYDAITERSDRIARLLMNMNAMFIGIISESEKIIGNNGLDIRKYSEHDKTVLMMCVNFAVAITKLLDIPVLDENGEIAQKAVEMIQTGEDYLTRINEIINQ